MRKSALDDYLFGEDPEDDNNSQSVLPENDADIQQEPVSNLRLGEPELRQPPDALSKYSGTEDDSGWSPNWLAGLAAFTRDPVLLDMVKRKADEPQRQLQQKMAMEDRQRKINQENREQQKFEAESPYFGAAAKSKDAYAAESAQRLKMARDLEDPLSPVSMSAADAASRSLMSTASMLAGKDQNTAKILNDASNAIKGKSAAEVKQYLSSNLGSIGKSALDAYQDAIRNQFSQDASARGWANIRQGEESLGLQRQAAEDKRQKEYDFQIGRPQEKLNKDINELEVGLQQMKELSGIKNSVNTGPLISGLRNSLKLNKFDEFTGSKRAELSALAARLFNRETKQLAGAAVSPSEWARIEPQIPVESDDDDVYMTKLKKAIEATNLILSERRKEYQQKDGVNIDKTYLAKEQNQKLKPTRSSPPGTDYQSQSKPRMAPSGSKPGQRFKSKSTGAIMEVQQDGTLKQVN